MKKNLFLVALSLYCFKIQCHLGEKGRNVCTEFAGEFSHEAAMKEFAAAKPEAELLWFSCRPITDGWREPRVSLKQK